VRRPMVLRCLCLNATGAPLSRSASALASVQTLERLIGDVRLRHGTLWTVSNALSARTSKVGSARRWCPLCYADWMDGESREMLAFQLDLCLVCPIRRCALASHCPACAAAQGATTPYWKRRICFTCGTKLDNAAAFPRLDPFEAWVQAQAEALVQLCAATDVFTICADAEQAALVDQLGLDAVQSIYAQPTLSNPILLASTTDLAQGRKRQDRVLAMRRGDIPRSVRMACLDRRMADLEAKGENPLVACLTRYSCSGNGMSRLLC